MGTDAQQEVIEFLAAPSTHGGQTVERIETHTAIVVLARSRALKPKRAVPFDPLGFSAPECRQARGEAEVRLNRRTAPALYHGVAAVTRERDGRLALSPSPQQSGGFGWASPPSPRQSSGFGGARSATPVDWVVVMERF